jgi:hypothetical protein
MTGSKLNADLIGALAHRFFVWGTLHRCNYGAAPLVQFNQHQSTSISTSPWFEQDIRLIERTIGIGFFYYGPRLWMIGEVEPLKALQEPTSRASVIDRILAEYPTTLLRVAEFFYRIRKDPKKPEDFGEYDSPPLAFAGKGRLDSPKFSSYVCAHKICQSASTNVASRQKTSCTLRRFRRPVTSSFLTYLRCCGKRMQRSSRASIWQCTCFSSLENTPTISPETSRARSISPGTMVSCTRHTSVFYALAACHSRQPMESRTDDFHSFTSMRRRKPFPT